MSYDPAVIDTLLARSVHLAEDPEPFPLELQRHITALADHLTAARNRVVELESQPVHVFDKLGADRMADEIAVLVQRKVIGSRCPAADALLDYRDPPQSPRSDRLVDLEFQVAKLRSEIDETREILGASDGAPLKQAAERVEVAFAERTRERDRLELDNRITRASLESANQHLRDLLEGAQANLARTEAELDLRRTVMELQTSQLAAQYLELPKDTGKPATVPLDESVLAERDRLRAEVEHGNNKLRRLYNAMCSAMANWEEPDPGDRHVSDAEWGRVCKAQEAVRAEMKAVFDASPGVLYVADTESPETLKGMSK